MTVIKAVHEEPAKDAEVIARIAAAESDPVRRQLLMTDLVSKSAHLSAERRWRLLAKALTGGLSPLMRAEVDSWPEPRDLDRRDVDLAIVTIKPNELRAAQVVFGVNRGRVEDNNLNGLRVWHGEVPMRDRRRKVSFVLSMVGEARGIPCAIACERLFGVYRPAACALLGMAAGLRTKVRLGDVVAAELVLDYEHQRLEQNGRKKRPEPYPLRGIARRNLNSFRPREWFAAIEKHCKQLDPHELPTLRRPLRPTFHTGVVLAGEKLLADGTLPDLQEEYHEQVRALEMEGSGFVRACEEHGIPWYVFRGVADYGEPSKDKSWQVVSTVSAGVALHEFIRRDLRFNQDVRKF